MAASLLGHVLGKYEIVDLLGRGGMATVYKAYQRDVDRYVAVKVLPPHPGQDADFVERFRLEARTIARLQHPHILPLYDYGNQDDILYLVTPYLEGGSLSDRIQQGPMPLSEVERVLQQIASALDYAHKHGMIHRDIKPDNVLLSAEGNVQLSDFGIVKLVEGGAALTASGGVVGTPAYMAPEQAQGLPPSPSLDIYALGVVVYEMITGQRPYTADTPMQVLFKHITEPIPDIDQVIDGLPPGIPLVMKRALAKDPAARYPTAGAFAAAFAEALHSQEATLGQSALAGRERPAPQRPITQQATTEESPPVTAAGVGAAAAPAWKANIGWLLLGGFGLFALLAAMVVLLVLFLGRESLGGGISPGTTQEVVGSTREPLAAAVSATPSPPSAAPTRLPSATPLATYGLLSFSTVNSLGDTANLRAENLAPLSEGFYAVWLLRSADGNVLPLGRLSVDAFGSGVLSFTDPEGRILPAVFDAVLITREQQLGDAPSGEAAYSGYIPPELATALGEILVSSEEGRPGESLLEGATQEAQIAARHAGLASGAVDIGGMRLHAEHTVNILLGTQDDLNGDGRGENPGLGFGLPYFLDHIDERLAAVFDAAENWPLPQTDIDLIRVCVTNNRTWMAQVVELERAILAASDFDAVMPQAATSADMAARLFDGYDLNGDGQVQPFEGECGLKQIAEYGIAGGSMAILQGPPPL